MNAITKDQAAMVSAYADALSAFAALTADGDALKDDMRRGFGTLLALRDVEGFSGREIAELDGVPVGTSQVARDLRAAEFLRDFPKADPVNVKKATDLLTSAQVKEARAAKNPLTALMEAAGLKKEERRKPRPEGNKTGGKKSTGKKADAVEVTDPAAFPGAVEALVRGFVKKIEAGEVDADMVARMRTVLQHADQTVAAARAPIAETA